MPQLIPEPGPRRVLAASNFVYTLGSGLYLTAGVLYFTKAVHLPAAQVGPGLLIALCITWGRPGWYVVGALFLLTGLAAPAAVRRAGVSRPSADTPPAERSPTGSAGSPPGRRSPA